MCPTVVLHKKVPGQCYPSRNSLCVKTLRRRRPPFSSGSCPILGQHVPRMERRLGDCTTFMELDGRTVRLVASRLATAVARDAKVTARSDDDGSRDALLGSCAGR